MCVCVCGTCVCVCVCVVSVCGKYECVCVYNSHKTQDCPPNLCHTVYSSVLRLDLSGKPWPFWGIGYICIVYALLDVQY